MFFFPVSATLHRRAFQPHHHRPLPAVASLRSALADEGASRAPRADVVESDAAYSVVLEMPGVAKEQVDVNVDGRRVTVSTRAATADASAADGQQRVLHRERGTTPYARTVTLPDDVDSTQCQARLENGVLTLTLAKRAAARATQIQVN